MYQQSTHINYRASSNDDHPAFQLIANGKVAELLSSKLSFADIESRNINNQTLVDIAAKHQQQAILDHFYQLAIDEYTENNQLDTSKTDAKGRAIIHWAAKCNQQQDEFMRLIDLGADVNDKRNSFNITPLYIAAQTNCIIAATALLASGADISCRAINGATPLHVAAQANHIDMLKLLLDNGALLNQTCDQNGTALAMACDQGHLQAVKLLLAADADTEVAIQHQATPLLIAVSKGRRDIATALVEAGANLDAPTPAGTSIREFAHASGFTGLVAPT